MKKSVLILSTLLLLPLSGFSMGTPPEGISLLLVPAQPTMVQLGKDMVERGHAILMTYADSTSPDEPFIHIWDGNRWLRVSPEKYRNGDFIRNQASKLVVVGDESDLTGRLIEQGLNWSPEVLHLGSLNDTELINQMGQLYEFDRREWEWVAKRYDLELEDMGTDTERVSWYDSHRGSTLPPPHRPWQRDQTPPAQAPRTSLTPVLPPAEEWTEKTDEDVPGEENHIAPPKESESTSTNPIHLELKP